MPTAQITLTVHNTIYNLLALIRGKVGSSNNPYPNQSPAVRSLNITADQANAGIVALIPDGIASPTVLKGKQILAGDSVYDQSSILNDVPLIDKNLVCDTDGSKIDVVWSNA